MRRRWPWVVAVGLFAFLLLWNLQSAREVRKPLRAQKAKTSQRTAAKARRVAAEEPAIPAPVPKVDRDGFFEEDADAVDDEGLRADGRVMLDFVITDYEGGPVDGAVLESSDCRVYRVAPRGKISVPVEEGKTCTFRAGRRDGMLMAWGENETLEAKAGKGATYLEIPIEETAGMGIAIAPHDRGVLVRWVVPGSPAETAGILRGDVVVELDGQPVKPLTVDEFIARGTGPVGTEVELVISRESGSGWEEQAVVLVRKHIQTQPQKRG